MINTASSDKKISSIVANAAVKSGAAFPLKGAKQAQKVKEFSKKDQVDLFRGLGSMLRAQINTADALKYYVHGLPNKMISAAHAQIREDINAGINVHEAFRRTGRFSETIIGLIQAGSDAGQLHHAFQALASRLKSSLHFEKQIPSKHKHFPNLISSSGAG